MKPSFFARRSFVILLVAVFLMPFVMRGTRLTLESNRNDVKDWLPSDFAETSVHRWYSQHFPLEQFVLASWDGCTLDDPRLEGLAELLETPPEETTQKDGQEPDPWFFKKVVTGRRILDEMEAKYLDESREELIDRLQGSLIGPDGESTCLIVYLTEEAGGKNLRKAIHKIHLLAQECGIEPEPEPPTGSLLTRSWDKITGFVSDLAFGRTVAEDKIRLGGPPVDNVAIDEEGECTLFRLAGLSAVVGLGIAWLVFRSIRLTLMVFFVGILAAGVGMASVSFSGASCDAILLSMPSLVYVLAISGSIHIVNYYRDAIRESGVAGAADRALATGWKPCTIAALTTSLGLGSLCASHVVPISKFGIYSAWGVLATLALIFLFLPALLHYYKTAGEILRAILGYVMPIPALLRYADRRVNTPLARAGEGGSDDSLVIRFWRVLGGGIVRHNVLVSLGCLLVMGFFIYGVTQIKTSVKLMKLFSSDAQIIADYTYLEEKIGPLVPMEVVLRIDNQKCDLSTAKRMELAQRVERVIENLDHVGGALSVATWVNAPRSDRFIDELAVSRIIERMRDEDPICEYISIDKEYAVADAGNYVGLRELGIGEETAKLLHKKGLNSLELIEKHAGRKPIEDALASVRGIGKDRAKAAAEAIEQWRSDHRDPTLAELGIPDDVCQRLGTRGIKTLLGIERHGKEDVSVATNLQEIGGIDAAKAAEVVALIDQWRTERGRELWRVSARVQALGDLDYAIFVEDLREKVEPLLAWYRANGVEGIEATYTGLVPLIYKTQHALMRGLFESLALAFVLIAIVMMIVLKSPTAGLVSMVPNLFPVAVIFGIMGWTGILVDIGSMMTASVALGVAVDDTIHYLTWFRRGLDQGRDRKGAAMLAYERCATAMTQTTLIGGLGLAVFAFSTFTPTQRFGTLMLTLLFAALFGDLIFLPAVLSGPIGRVFRASKKKDRQPADQPTDLESEVDQDVVAGHISGQATVSSRRKDGIHRSTRAS